MKVLLTCGIGDFIAVESMLLDSERLAVDTIYWATRAEKALKELVPFCFPNVRNHVTLFDQFTGPDTELFCFESKMDVWKRGNHNPHMWDWRQVEDWSVLSISEQFWAGARQCVRSSLVWSPREVRLADVSGFDLPWGEYVVLHPYSENARKDFRDLNEREWAAVGSSLVREGAKAVVLNRGDSVMPRLPNVIDLTNQTTLLEALEIVKCAQGFVGCSSCFSVMAAKANVVRPLIVKGHKGLKDKWWEFYYQPVRRCPVYTSLTPSLAHLLGERE